MPLAAQRRVMPLAATRAPRAGAKKTGLPQGNPKFTIRKRRGARRYSAASSSAEAASFDFKMLREPPLMACAML